MCIHDKNDARIYRCRYTLGSGLRICKEREGPSSPQRRAGLDGTVQNTTTDSYYNREDTPHAIYNDT